MFELPRAWPKRIALLALSVLFVGAGVNHFANPSVYVEIMPPYLPAHLELVYLSGICEVLGGLGVLPRALRPLAGRGLVLLLVAIFPANLHMALHPELFPGVPAWALAARLPLQLALIAWAWWATRPDAPAPAT